MKHTPVLLNDVLELAQPLSAHQGVFIDGTFGRGGHTRELLKTLNDFDFVALDCDDEAILFAEKNFTTEISAQRLQIVKSNFLYIDQVVEKLRHKNNKNIMGILLDLGVSSPQLDEGRRGFSFYHDGPLDMRMDQTLSLAAADIVNSWDEDNLNSLFQEKGEVRRPFRVTQKIIEHRKEKAFSTTGELAQLIEKTEGRHKKGHHPATQFFMALRLEVNQELELLEKVLPKLVEILSPGGRLFVITFHSLEDRIVKVSFKKSCDENKGHLINKKVIQATWDEKKSNPRSRSAKLRVFEKL